MANRTEAKKTKTRLVAAPSGEKWQLVRFGDVVRDVKAKIDRETTELTRYVAGEHMDSDDIHLRRWGELNGDYLGPAFHRGFRKGQVLYGSRRTYLKKVAVARFDGICANTTFVLESRNPDTLLPQLLPFIMLTDAFTQHSIRESKGSVNPYVNWKDIAKYEFLLPPKDEQRRIAEILWASDMSVEQFIEVVHACHLYRQSFTADFFRHGAAETSPSHDDWRVLTGQQLLDEGYLTALQDGNHGGQYPRADEFGDDGVPYLSAAFISDQGEIDLAGCPRLPLKRASQLRIPPARGGDVILTNNATVGRVAVLPSDCGEIIASTSTTYYRVGHDLNRDYLAEYLRSVPFQQQLSRVMVQSTRHQVPITTQKKLLFIIPPMEEQVAFACRVRAINERQRMLVAHLGSLRTLKAWLTNELIAGVSNVH